MTATTKSLSSYLTRTSHSRICRHQVRSFFSLLQSPTLPKEVSKQDVIDLQPSLNHAVNMVRKHDPAGYLPGKLLPSTTMQCTYFAVRSFWVETGLRFGTTAEVPPNSSPLQHLEWWQKGIQQIYTQNDNDSNNNVPMNHPTLKLLSFLISKTGLNQCHFHDIMNGRFQDLNVTQYADLASLEKHTLLSCGSLAQLVLESEGLFENDFPIPHRAAKLTGQAHGLTNALRTSIPVVSTTGKLIIPKDLCVKYGVKSPRYLLSALGQGDKECIQALQNAVRDIVERARHYLNESRNLREDVIKAHPNATAVLLPGLASETFLNRLEQYNYDLTNRDLRHVHWLEHAQCAIRMIQSSYKNQY